MLTARVDAHRICGHRREKSVDYQIGRGVSSGEFPINTPSYRRGGALRWEVGRVSENSSDLLRIVRADILDNQASSAGRSILIGVHHAGAKQAEFVNAISAQTCRGCGTEVAV
jgi:hypothetical protein